MKFLKLTFRNFTEIEYSADRVTEKAIQREMSFKMDNFYVVAAKNPWMKKDPESGLVHLIKDCIIPIGFLDDVLKIAKRQGSKVTLTNKEKFKLLRNNVDNIDKDVIKSYISEEFLDSIGGELYDYQYQAILAVIKNKTGMVSLHPGAGKSLVLFGLIVYMYNEVSNNIFDDSKLVISVPSISLVEQMYSDISEYSNSKFDDLIGLIYSQAPKKYKTWDKPIIITTHNSLKSNKQYHNSIKAIMVDEAHELKCGKFEESNLIKTLFNLKAAEYRVALSGSFVDIVNDPKANELHYYRVKKNFGKTLIKVDYAESISKGRLTDFEIENIYYDYLNEDDKECIAYGDYSTTNILLNGQDNRPKIMDYLIKNRFKEGDNTFIIFLFKESLDQFKRYLEANHPEYEYFVIKGEVKGKVREQYRQYVSQHRSCILLGTYRTVSRGINVKNLDNIVVVDGIKVKDGIKQIIGRVLRLSEGKSLAKIYFIIDNAWVGRKMGVLVKQSMVRLKQFIVEKWKHKNIFLNVDLEEYEDEKLLKKIREHSLK